MDFVAALSLANLYMMSVWDELHDRWFDYFRDMPYQTWPVYFRAIVDLALLALLFWGLIAAARRARPAIVRKGCAVLLLGVFGLGLESLRIHGLRLYGAPVVQLLGKPVLAIAAAAATLALLYLLVHDRLLTRGMRTALTILFAAVPINLASTAWAIHSTWPAEQFRAQSSLPLLPARAEAPRVVWVIFDMWDYDATFPERRPGLSLPEVDRLQREALYAENAVPPAGQTLESIPSLTLGRIVSVAQHESPDELKLRFRGSKEMAGWKTQQNIFQEARAAGVNSAVVGFYHPYSRILGGSVAHSYSLPFLTLHHTPRYWQEWEGMERVSMEVEEALYRAPWIQEFTPLKGRRAKRISRYLYLDIREKALRAATSPELGLVFLHLPIPHVPAIYDRERKEVTADNHGDYTDNLALMDRTLGELRAAMEAKGQWDRSIVLVSTDHPLQSRYPKHPKIPFLLKMAGQTHSVRYTRPFNTVVSHDLVLASLRRELRSGEDVADWLNTARLRFPTEADTE